MNNWKLPILDQQRCTQCGICAKSCPEQVMEMVDGLPVFARPQDCNFCTTCESVCPTGAIHCGFTVAWDDQL